METEQKPAKKEKKKVKTKPGVGADDLVHTVESMITPDLIERIRNGEEIEINISEDAPKDRGKSPFGKKTS
jgi:hypothetical protein